MMIYINSRFQTLSAHLEGGVIFKYAISTAKNGLGEQNGSGCTPRGWHEIKEMIGKDAQFGTIFQSRLPTGKVWHAKKNDWQEEQDLITTRILWLSGLESGRNLGGNVDTYSRYIYIHGTPHEANLGKPVSHGCIRMANKDVIDLFNHVEPGMKVFIE